MNKEDCVKIGKVLAGNFAGKIKVYLFGSAVRAFKKGLELEEAEYGRRVGDLDFFVEVEMEVFEAYCQKCENQALQFSGMPFDQFDLYWEYHSPVAVRMGIIIDEILEISSHEELGNALKRYRFDVIMLPFDWQKNKEVLEVINRRDRKFSESMKKDAILLFEK